MDAAPGSPARPKPDRSLCACPAAGGHRKADYLQAIADDGEPHLASGIIEAGPHPDRERRTAASGRGPLFVAPGSGRRARRRLAAGPANNRGSVMIKATPIRTAPSALPTKIAPVGGSRARANAVRNFVLECTRRRIVVRSPTYEPDKTQAASASSDASDWRACLSCRLAIASLCNPNIDMPSTIEVLTGFHADIKMGGDTRTMRARAMAGSTEAWEFCGNRSSARLFQSAFWVESGFMA